MYRSGRNEADSKFLEAPAVSSAENVRRAGLCAGSDFTISYRSCVFFLHFSKCSINIKDTWRGIEVVITGLTRNQFASNRTWVRIPSSPPKSPVNSRVFWTFPFSRQGVDLAKNAGNPAIFRLFFARLLELAMSEKPYISRLFGVALIFLQELCLPALTFGVRKRKNIVHNIRGSDLGFVVQMAVNIRRCADITVSEPFLYLLHRNIVCKKQ